MTYEEKKRPPKIAKLKAWNYWNKFICLPLLKYIHTFSAFAFSYFNILCFLLPFKMQVKDSSRIYHVMFYALFNLSTLGIAINWWSCVTFSNKTWNNIRKKWKTTKNWENKPSQGEWIKFKMHLTVLAGELA